MTNYTCRKIWRVLLFTGICAIANPALSDDKEKVSRVYDNIPANWENNYLADDIIKMHTGKKVRKVCYDKDIVKNGSEYRTLRIRRGPSSFHFVLFAGGSEFSVIGDHELLVTTEHTGTHLIKTRDGPCYKSLPRAKYIIFRKESDRRRCLSRRHKLSVLTGFRQGLAICEIKSIHVWKGDYSSAIQPITDDGNVRTGDMHHDSANHNNRENP